MEYSWRWKAEDSLAYQMSLLKMSSANRLSIHLLLQKLHLTDAIDLSLCPFIADVA